MKVETDDLVCQAEIAEMAGVRDSAVSNWRNRDIGFPLPHVTLRLGSLWLREEVETWLAERASKTEQSRQRAISYHERRLQELRRQA